MQIDRGGMLQRFVLLAYNIDNVWMTVPDADRHDTAERVEIAFVVLVPHVLHFPFHEHERLFVVQKNSRIQKFPAQLKHLLGRGAAVLFWLMVKWRKLGSFHVDLFPKVRRAR